MGDRIFKLIILKANFNYSIITNALSYQCDIYVSYIYTFIYNTERYEKRLEDCIIDIFKVTGKREHHIAQSLLNDTIISR